MARPIEIIDIETGKTYHFNKIKDSCDLLNTSTKALNYYLRENKTNKPYRNRWLISYSDFKIEKPDEKPEISRKTKEGIWKLSQTKQFPNVLVAETKLPFYNEHYFNIIKYATKAFFGKKEYMIWFDNAKPEIDHNPNWERQFCKMQILFKFNCITSFQSKINTRKIFLDKMEQLIKGLNELKKEDELDEIYRRTIEDGIA